MVDSVVMPLAAFYAGALESKMSMYEIQSMYSMRKFDELRLNQLEHGIAFLEDYVIIRANRSVTFMIFTFSVIDYHLET